MLARQAKILNDRQIQALLSYLAATRAPERNRAIFLLSVRAGLRAKEIAALKWSMITDAEGWIADMIRLPDVASKGKSGGTIPMARDLRQSLIVWARARGSIDPSHHVVSTQRSDGTSAQMIINLFRGWYHALGFDGCSSHSGRRTFITNAARNIGRFGGSLRDVQALARHSSLSITQSYIEIDSEAMRKVIGC